MLRIREIMTGDPVTLGPDLSLREAAERLAGLHISGAPVVSGDEVLGVLSLSDIVEFIVNAPRLPDDERVRGIEAVDGDLEAFATFYADIGADDMADVVERMHNLDTGGWDTLSEHSVREAMSDEVFALPPTASVSAAAEYMQQREIHRLLVVEGGCLVGIVSALDVVRAVAEHLVTTRTYVFPYPTSMAPRRRP